MFKIEDTSPTRCQCIMDHYSKVEGGISQCTEPRDPSSNLFCDNCEQTHGDYWREKHAKELLAKADES